jgi:hypothetical protein
MNEVNNGASSQSSSQSPLSLAETGEHTYTEVCYGAEGSIQSINGRDYRTYCYNSKWNGFVGMGYLPTLEGELFLRHTALEPFAKLFVRMRVKV